jgi:hypothetical protein
MAAGHDGGRLHGRYDRHHVGAEGLPVAGEELGADDEGDDADRAEGRGHGGGVVDGEEFAQSEKCRDSHQHGHEHHGVINEMPFHTGQRVRRSATFSSHQNPSL